MTLTLYDYPPSLYCRGVRFALATLAVPYVRHQIDPFQPPPGQVNPHPFGRVPVLQHHAFVLSETAAILGYLDETFGAGWRPAAPQAQARVAEVQGIADAYAYWPLVRQVYAQAVARPRLALAVDAGALAEGLAAARRLLPVFERIAAERLVLVPGQVTRADFHLAPMLAGFAEAPEGRAMLAAHPGVAAWLASVTARPAWAAAG